MEVGFVLKIAGIGLIVTVVNLFLNKSGRDDYASLVTIAGIIVSVIVLIGKLGEVIETIKGVFNVV
jgi:stage III sporulation protein AC